MNVSSRGLGLVANFEGFVAKPYNDVAGHATVGYGHLLHFGNVTAADRRDTWVSGQDTPGILTRAEGEQLLRKDLQRFEDAVDAAVDVSVSQAEFDALVSLTFNIGTAGFEDSTVLRKLNSGDRDEATAAFLLWVKAGGRTEPGLVARRKTEASIFACRAWWAYDFLLDNLR